MPTVADEIGNFPGSNISLVEPSIVKLPISPELVTAYEKSGNNLILKLENGKNVSVLDFFKVAEDGTRSELVLEAADGTQYWGQYEQPWSEFSFTQIDEAERNALAEAEAEAAARGDSAAPVELTGGAAEHDFNWLVGAFAVLAGAGIAIFRDSLSSSGSSGEPSDNEAPGAPTDVGFADDGKTLVGKGEPGATVNVKDQDGNPVLDANGDPITGKVDDDGNFSVVIEPPPAAGTEFDVTLTDGAGNESDPTKVVAPGEPTNPDTEAPEAPTDVAFAEDGKTLTGKGEAGATVVLKDKDGNPVLGADGQPVTGQVGADGSFSVVVEPAPAAGTEIQVSLKDAAGNESDATTVTAPGTPTNPDTEAPDAPTDVAFAEDGKTLTGKGEAGATVVLKDKDGNPVLGADGQPVTGQVGADGSFSVVVEPAPAAGTEIQVSLKDAAGNESDATTVTAPGTPTNPDTEAPEAPTDVAFAEDGKTLTGKGEAGATVVLKDKDGNPVLGADGQPVTGQVGADGSFSVVVEPAPAAGTEIQVSLKDAAGNESDATTVTAPGTPTNPDTEAPEAPTDVAFAEDGKTLTGKGETGATVVLKDKDGNPVLGADGQPVTGQVGADGSFSVVVEPAPAAGTEIQVSLKDAAGNESDATTVTAPGTPTNPDTEAPAAPTDVAFAEDGKTLTGKGETGATVVLKDKDGNPVLGADGQPVTGQVGADGSFSVVVEPAPAAGTEIQVSLKDAAGNESDATTVTAPGTPTNPDTEAPDAPTDVAFAEDGKTLTGKGEAGATVVLKDKDGNPVLGADGQPVTGQVGADGSFSVVVEPAPAAGTEIQVSLKDAAGNESDATTVTAPGTPTNPDTEAPAAPTDVAFAEDGKTLTGKGETGATVVLKDKDGNPVLGADGQPVTGQVGADGSFSVVVEPAPAAGTEIQVSLKDAAGNESDATTVTAPGTPTNPDTEAPAAPTDVAFAEDGKTLTGKGEAGATVVLKDKDGNLVKDANGQVVTAQVGANGEFAVVFEPAPAAGTEFHVSLKDAAGNESDPASVTAPGTPTNPDTEAPDAPTDVAFLPDGKTLTGKGEAGATVILKDKDGNAVQDGNGHDLTGKVDADGNFVVVFNAPPAAGTEFKVSLQDEAGNESDPASAVAPGEPARIQANDDAQDASMAIAVGPKNVSSDSAYAKSDLSLNLLKVGLNKVLGVDLLDLNLLTGTSSFDINVGSGQTHTVGFKVKAGGVLGLLTTVSVHIYYELPDGQWAPYQSFKDKFIGINLLGLSPSVKIDGVVLPEGKYKVLVEETGGISLLETIKVSTTSYLVTDINTAGPDDITVEAVSGNVMQDDATYDSTRLNTVNGKAVAAEGSTEIEGQYGVLTVHADGSYSYQAFADTANVGKSDVFVYEIYDADRNQSSQAKLTIDIKGEVVEPAAAKAAVLEHDVTDDAGAADAVADQADDSDEGHEGDSQDAASQGEDGSLMLDLLQAAETQHTDTPAADAGTPLLSDSGIDLDGLLQDTPAAAGGVVDGVEEAFAAPVAATATPEIGIDDAIAAGPASVSLDDLLQQNALVY